MKGIEKAILRTLTYAGLFSYPLRDSEIWQYLISSKPFSGATITKHLLRMTTDFTILGTSGTGFYFLLHPRGGRLDSPLPPLHPRGGRLDSPGVDIIKLRQKRTSTSKLKLKKAVNIVRWLRRIPSVKMIGVTGSLAMLNAGKSDDIDLLCIASPRRLWLTRGLVVLGLRLLGLYRRPSKTQDRICPNLFLDTEHLGLAASERNLFTAHEIAQVKCLWDKEGTYNRFLAANHWVLDFLPNAFGKEASLFQRFKVSKINHNNNNSVAVQLCNFASLVFKILLPDILLDRLEVIAYRMQIRYMRSRRTREITEPGRIFFHPTDRGSKILLKYQKRLTELGIK